MNFQLTKKRRKTLCLFLIIAAFISSLFILTGRIRMESANKSVEIAVDYSDVENMARRENVPIGNLLEKFKMAGVTSVAFSETSLTQLQERGRLRFMPGGEILSINSITGAKDGKNLSKINPASFYVFDDSPEAGKMLKNNLSMLMGNKSFREFSMPLAGGKPVNVIEVQGNSRDFAFAGIGFDESLVKSVKDEGFDLILRPENRPGMDQEMIDKYFSQIAKIQEQTTLIFGGPTNEVSGFPENLDATVNAMKKFNLVFGDIEAPNAKAKQKGSQYIGMHLPGGMVRVQSITEQYLAKMPPQNAVDMFRLGVRERNIRLLYLRPYQAGLDGKNVIDTNLSYISELKKEIGNYNFMTGKASRFPVTNPPAALIVIITLGAAGIFLLLLDEFQNYNGAIGIATIILAALFSLGLCIIGKPHIVQKITGMALAIIFPVYAFASHFEIVKSIKEKKGFLQTAGFSLLIFTRITLITLAGGLIMAALFTSTTFMLGIDRFSGVKLLMVVPPMLTVLLFYLKGSNENNTIKSLLEKPLYIWQVILLGVMGAAGLVYILRTGNNAGDLATDQERQVRTALDALLWVRPRFKDFMIGHPALILTFALASLKKFTGLGILVLAAAIGQADIMDTFAHIHTPIFITLVRIINGAIIGAVVGSIMLLIYWLAAAKTQPQAVANTKTDTIPA